jgi:hypothetical protein
MTREEPSLETVWLQNIRTMDKVQIIDRSNTAASSKSFRDAIGYACKLFFYICVSTIVIIRYPSGVI